MPPRKEPKSTVVYPASKRKPPPFKPQRPSQVPRIPTTESESNRRTISKPSFPARKKQKTRVQEDHEDSDNEKSSPIAGAEKTDSDEELDDNPLASRAKKKKLSTATRPAATKRQPSRQSSPLSVSSRESSTPLLDQSLAAGDLSSTLSQFESIPVLPQPLLVRLLHEHFAEKDTRIDKHAIQVLQKYFEVFIREAIMRARSKKREDAEAAGNPSGVDADWLELEDLEKVAAHMLLDF